MSNQQLNDLSKEKIPFSNDDNRVKSANSSIINNKVSPRDSDTSTQLINEKEMDTKEEKRLKAKTIVIAILKALVSTILGFLFGWAMEKSKVYEPIAIRQQMIFTKFIMMKMFFTALAMSTVSIFFFSLIFTERYQSKFKRSQNSLKNKSFLLIISGALMIGVGMTVSGACPGMVFVQMGAGVPWSYLTLVGCLIGALLHGLIVKYIMERSKPNLILSKAVFELAAVCTEKKFIPYIFRAVFIIVIAIAVFLMEYFIPWQSEYSDAIVSNSTNILIYKAWPPYTCGILFGSLQFFSLLILSKSLGASSAYSTIVGVPFACKTLQEKFPYFAEFRTSLNNWLRVFYVCGAILGAFGSSYASGAFATAQGVHPYNAILGGAIMSFGARLAGGCTSGHGISGASHLYIGSLVAMAFMFGGAIPTAFYAYTNSFFF